MNLKVKINEYKKIINYELKNIYKNGPDSLVNSINYINDASGKRLRPILTLLTNDVCGGKINDVLPAAISIELLHNFTLVHDDVMDNDDLRRGVETIHKKWGVGNAILTGDAMFAIALKNIHNNYNFNSKIPKIFTNALLAICEGQAYDVEFETSKNITLEKYIKMIDLKTGFIIGISAKIGSIVAGVDNKTTSIFMEYGKLIGRAFQIQDDLFEIFSDQRNMGKTLTSDIVLGKKTYMMILAESEIKNDIKKAMNIASKNITLGINKIKELLIESGIKLRTESYIDSIFNDAIDLLKTLDIKSDELIYFTEIISKRRK